MTDKSDAITIIRGDDYTIPVQFSDEAGGFVDISDTKVFFTVKSSVSEEDASAVIQKDWETHFDPINGLTNLVLTNTDTLITPGEYLYDLQIDLNGKLHSVFAGRFYVKGDITRRSS